MFCRRPGRRNEPIFLSTNSLHPFRYAGDAGGAQAALNEMRRVRPRSAWRHFDGAGLQLTRTNLRASGWSAGGNLDRVTAHDNYVGIRFDIRSEYINATNLSAFRNVIGCAIHAGNAKISASNFGGNIDGIVIDEKENGSHGAISNCLVNHNERYALLVKNARNGMVIDGCCFFRG